MVQLVRRRRTKAMEDRKELLLLLAAAVERRRPAFLPMDCKWSSARLWPVGRDFEPRWLVTLTAQRGQCAMDSDRGSMKVALHCDRHGAPVARLHTLPLGLCGCNGT